MKKLAFGICTLIVMLMCMTVSAQDYSPEIGNGSLSFEFSKIYGGTVGSSTTFEREDVLFKDYPAVKLVPTPETAQGSLVTLDSWTLAAFGSKVEVPKYRYVGVKYYYETDAPTYKGKMTFSVLSGSTQAVNNYVTESLQPIVTNTWTEAVFDLTGMEINPDSSKPWINQVHFRPFGNTAPTALKPTDVLYVSSYTFYEYNPMSYADSDIRFLKGTPEAAGTDSSVTIKHGETYDLPENPYTFEGAEFVG